MSEQHEQDNPDYPVVDQFTGAELRHHAFDGIQEYDNNLPLWWQSILYISIVVAIIYVGWFHFGPGQLGPERLETQLAAVNEQRLALLAEQGELNEETLREFLTDANRIALGRGLYGSLNCAQCHQADGLGQIGPNLRDDYWKWGSNMLDIYDTLKNGRNNNAMPKHDIPRDDLINLTAYIVHWNKTEKAHGRGVQIDGEVLAPIDY